MKTNEYIIKLLFVIVGILLSATAYLYNDSVAHTKRELDSNSQDIKNYKERIIRLEVLLEGFRERQR